MMTNSILKSIGISWLLIFSFAGNAQEVDWHKLIEEWRMAYHVPGLSVGIIKEGEILLSAGYGVKEEGKKDKVDQHTLYSIASNTKAFLATAIGTLVEEEKLAWDDPVRKHLPYFQLYDPCVSEMTTIRDLLCHRTGLGTFSGDVIWYRSNHGPTEIIKRASELPAQFEFRNGYGYSNVMYITAGEVIHKVTGMPWDQYVNKTFIEPLGMDRTITSVTALQAMQNVATPHKTDASGNHPINWVNWDNMGAAAGMISSSDDMLKWIQLQLNRGKINNDTFYQNATQAVIWTPHVSFPVSQRARDVFQRNFSAYGLGWNLNDFKGHFVASHTGGYDGMYSSVTILPNDKIGIVVLTNSMTSIGTMLSYEILDRLFQLPQQDWKQRGINQDIAGWNDRLQRIKQRSDVRVTGTSPSLSHDEITGTYDDALYGNIRIEKAGNELVLDFVPAPGLKAKLTHWHYDTYQINWMHEQAWFGFGTVQIVKDNNGKAHHLVFDVPNDDIFFEEINAVRLSP